MNRLAKVFSAAVVSVLSISLIAGTVGFSA